MKNKEEPSIDLMRGSPSPQSVNSNGETTGSLSRQGLTASAPIKKPALSLIREFLIETVADAANTEPVTLTLL